jgi:NADH-quinone oxidoreductase subunit E
MSNDEIKREKLMKMLKGFDKSEASILPVLHKTQEIYGIIPENAQLAISNELNIPLAKIYSNVTFFSHFNQGFDVKYVISVCNSSVCRVNGSNELVDWLEKTLNIKIGEKTADNFFALRYTPCFGACDISPAIRINDEVFGNLDLRQVGALIETYRKE